MIADALRHLYCTLLVILDSLFIHSKRKKQGVALVRMDAIGDFIIWTHSVGEYRKLFPKKKIILIANSSWADLAKKFSYWDEVWSVDRRLFLNNVLYRWRTLRNISNAGFEIAIQPTFSRGLLLGDSIMRATKASKVIGSIGDLNNIRISQKDISDHWFTLLVPAVQKPLTEIERNVEFLSNFCGVPFVPTLKILPALTELPQKFQLSEPYLIIFPGAAWYGRQWPVKSFARVMERLHEKFGLQIVICGSANERKLCQNICDEANVHALNIAGETTLAELVELTRRAKLLIGNETSAIHIAVAVGIQSICILGGGHYGRFVPYPVSVHGVKPIVAVNFMECFNCNWNCNQPHRSERPVPCIENISIDAVVDLSLRAIEESQHETIYAASKSL